MTAAAVMVIEALQPEAISECIDDLTRALPTAKPARMVQLWEDIFHLSITRHLVTGGDMRIPRLVKKEAGHA